MSTHTHPVEDAEVKEKKKINSIRKTGMTQEKKTCRLCGEEKPLNQFRELLTNSRVNKKGIRVDYFYRENRCDDCRKRENREAMAKKKAKQKVKKKRVVENVTSPYTKTHYDNAFVFSSDINRWH